MVLEANEILPSAGALSRAGPRPDTQIVLLVFAASLRRRRAPGARPATCCLGSGPLVYRSRALEAQPSLLLLRPAANRTLSCLNARKGRHGTRPTPGPPH